MLDAVCYRCELHRVQPIRHHFDDGSCATAVVEGCRYENASNYNPLANVDDNSCVFEDTGSDCPGDLDNDGAVATADLLQFLSFFGQTCL